MNQSKKLTLVGFSSLLILASSHANAQILTVWNFENDPIAVNNTPATSYGTGSADAIGMATYMTPNVGVNQDDVLQGATGDTGSNTVADLSQIWRIRGQAGSSGAANGWSSAAPIGTQGAQFFTSTSGVTTGAVKVSFDWYATTQGEANLQLDYTTDGTSWINAPLTLGGSDNGLVTATNSSNANIVNGSYVSDNKAVNGSPAGQDWFTGLTATITDPNALNDPNFGIELVNAATGTADVSTAGTALNNTSGNWRFDNVTIFASAAPEPRSWALAAIALGVVVVLRRRFARLL